MKRKKLLIGLSIAVLLSLIIGLNIYRNLQGTTTPVQVFKVKQEKIEENILASGKVEAVEKEEITARTNAMVQDVSVQEGDLVKAGQVLARLDGAELVRSLRQEEANLAVQRANLAKADAGARPQQVAQDRAELKRAEVAFAAAKAKNERSQNLYKEGAISKEELEAAYTEFITAETSYRSAQQRLSLSLEGETKESVQALRAQVKQAEVAVALAGEQLAQTEIKASMDGVVLSLEVEKGQYVTTGTILVTVGNPGLLQVKADISETDGGNLSIGQPVKITCSAIPDGQFTGEVTRVGAAAVTKVKSSGEQTDVRVTVSITDTGTKLKPGYTVDLNITTASKPKALVIPHEAVIEKNKIKEVFVIENKKAVKHRIQTGIGNELYLTVEKGLREGEKVVVNPADKLTSGSPVAETPYETAKPADAKIGD